MLIVTVKKFLLRFWPFQYRPSEVELMMADDNQELYDLNRTLLSQLRSSTNLIRQMKEKQQALEAEIELLRRRRHGQC